MRILVVGAGGVGGYFGGRLIEADADVTFLVRRPRAEALARQGLVVSSPLGDLSVPVKTVTADRLTGDFDLILLSCKAYDLAGVIDTIKPAATGRTGILPLLNGVAHIEILKQQFGASCVLGGLAHLAVTLEPGGAIRHLAPHCAIRFGALGGGADPWTGALLEAFTGARVDAVRSSVIMQDMWDKFVFLATLAGMTCLLRASVGTILGTIHGAGLTETLLAECAAVATAEGFPPDEQALTRYRATLTERGSSVTASMLRDIERGGPTEAEHVFGDLVSRAMRHGIAVPLLLVAYTHLQAYELRRAGNAGGG